MKEDVFTRIDNLMKEQRKQQKEMNEYLKLGERTYDNWKSGKSSSYLKHLDEIARFLGVSPNYLVTGIDKYNYAKSSIEEELIDFFRNLSDANQTLVLNLTKALSVG